MLHRFAPPLFLAASTLAASAQQVETTIVDQRPKTESDVLATMGWMTFSKGYGMARNGDKSTKQLPLDLLRQRVAEHGGGTVTVYHLVSYSNAQASMRNVSAKGLVGALLDKSVGGDYPTSTALVDRGRFESYLEGDEWHRATYTDEENPKMTSVDITFLDAEIGGKREIVRAMTPVKRADDKSPPDEAVETAIRFWLAQVQGTPAQAPQAASGAASDVAH